MSRIIPSILMVASFAAIATTSSAGCYGNTTCNTTNYNNNLQPLGSWSGYSQPSHLSLNGYAQASSSNGYSYAAPSYTSPTYTSQSYTNQSYSAPTYSGSNYTGSSYSSPSYTSSSHNVMSSSTADAVYGTGSISSAYTGGDVEIFNDQAAPSVPGLGANESLQATSCPVNVYNPDNGQVKDCYNVVKTAPRPTYTQVAPPAVYAAPQPVYVSRPAPVIYAPAQSPYCHTPRARYSAPHYNNHCR